MLNHAITFKLKGNNGLINNTLYSPYESQMQGIPVLVCIMHIKSSILGTGHCMQPVWFPTCASHGELWAFDWSLTCHENSINTDMDVFLNCP